MLTRVIHYPCQSFSTGERWRVQSDSRERRLVLWLKKERLKQGISATALAAKIGLSRAAITHIEADRCHPTLATLLKISDGLKISPKKWASHL